MKTKQDHQFNFSYNLYRIKKEQKLAAWTSEDVPPLCWIREKRHTLVPIKKYLILEVHDFVGVKCNSHDVGFSDLFEHYEHSTDGKTWLPCSKEVL